LTTLLVAEVGEVAVVDLLFTVLLAFIFLSACTGVVTALLFNVLRGVLLIVLRFLFATD
jgi:hypothetical protein